MNVLNDTEVEQVGGGLENAFLQAFLLAATIVEVGNGFVDGMRDGLNGSTNGSNLACPATSSIN